MAVHGTLHGRSPVGKRARRAEHMHAAARNAARTLTVAADVECPPLPPPLLPLLPLATAADVARESASSRASLASSASSVVTSVELPFGTCCGETGRRGKRVHARQGRVELPFWNSLWGTRCGIKGHQESSRAIKSHQEPSRVIKSHRHLHIRMARREAASARRRLLPLAVQPHERAGRRAGRRRASRYRLYADGTVRVWLEEGGYEFRELAVLEHLMREAISRSSKSIKRQSEVISRLST